MPRKIIYFLLFLALSCLTMAGTKGRIKGKVVDATTGEPLIGANVTIIGTTFGAATDVEGGYVILNIDAGVYDLKVSYLGYQSQTVKGVRVNADLTFYQDFKLSSEDISTAVVEIVATKPLIKKDATSSVRIADAEQMKNLPVRGLNNVLSLQAGVVNDGGIRIRGSRPDEVNFYMDGVDISDPVNGGRAASISQDALEEVQIETGGFTAEYGGQAGIVRTQIKSGGPQLHASFEHFTDNFAFISKDDLYNQTKKLGTYTYGTDESVFTLSGPLYKQNIRFMYNFNYRYDGTGSVFSQDGYDFGILDNDDVGGRKGSPDSLHFHRPAAVGLQDRFRRYTHTGSLTFDYNKYQLKLSGVYTTSNEQLGGGIFNSRHDVREREELAATAKFTHVLSNSVFYELTGGYTYIDVKEGDVLLGDNIWAYGDSLANVKAGAKFDPNVATLGAYRRPNNYSYYIWAFSSPDQVTRSPHFKRENTGLTLKGDVSVLLKHHTIKVGAEYKTYKVRRWASRDQHSYAEALNDKVKAWKTANRGATIPPSKVNEFKKEVLLQNGVNTYGYDLFGNKVDNGEVFRPRKPVFAAFYITDKIEFEDLILQVGLRWEYIDIDMWQLKDPSKPELGYGTPAEKATGAVKLDGFKDAETHTYLMPRISASFPITDNTVFYASYGKYVGQPRLNDSYLGYNWLGYFLSSRFFETGPRNVVDPVQITKYNLGFRQVLSDNLALDITGFYEDTKDQVLFIEQDVLNSSEYNDPYNSRKNGDYATTKGVEVTLDMRRTNRLAMRASLSFTSAEGTGSNPNSNAGIVGAPIDGVVFIPKYISPLEHNRPVTGTIMLDYRWGDEDGISALNNLGINVLGTYNSGHPFTRGTGNTSMRTSARNRTPVEPIGASLTPSGFNLDLKIDKTFDIWDQLKANVYVRVVNVFNKQRVDNVYRRTGDPKNDGQLYNPDLYGQNYQGNPKKRAIFEKMYKTFTGKYSPNVSGARQIFLGIRLEY